MREARQALAQIDQDLRLALEAELDTLAASPADQRDADGWTRIEALAGTVRSEELLGLSTEDLLLRLFHEETVRVFAAQEVTANNPKDWEKVRQMLLTLGREEVYAALQQNSAIVIRDDLSNHEYRFERAEVDKLFSQIPETPPTVH